MTSGWGTGRTSGQRSSQTRQGRPQLVLGRLALPCFSLTTSEVVMEAGEKAAPTASPRSSVRVTPGEGTAGTGRRVAGQMEDSAKAGAQRQAARSLAARGESPGSALRLASLPGPGQGPRPILLKYNRTR